jgi:hypothetical protein
MGAPGAIQVADRFHLLQNASVALEVHCLNALDTRSYALAICSLDRLKSMKYKMGPRPLRASGDGEDGASKIVKAHDRSLALVPLR